MVERIKRRNIMREFVIKELSAVDRPAQEHARMTIMKRDDSDDVEKNTPEIPSAITKRWLDPAEGARPFSDFLDSNLDSDRIRDMRQAVGSYVDALDSTLYSIAFDGGLTPDQKMLSMREAVEGFMGSVRDKWPDVAVDVTKALNSGEENMADDVKKQVADLQKNIEDLTKKLDAATTDDVAKKASELQEQLDEALAKVDDLTKKVQAEEAEKAEALAKAGMSDKEKMYMEGLSDEDAKKNFMSAKPEERAKMMTKAADADPVVYKSERTGEEFHKSDDPRLVAYAKRSDEDAKVAKSEREARINSELAKRVTEEPIVKFAGEPDEKVEVLRAIDKMDAGPRETLLKMLEAGGKAIGAAFETIGHRSGEVRKASEVFEKKVDDIMKRDNIKRSDAMSKARAEDPEAFQAYQDAGQAN